MMSALPPVLQVALLLCVPIWGVTELMDEALKRASEAALLRYAQYGAPGSPAPIVYKERWWGWLLLRILPPLVGVACLSSPSLWAWLREDLLGLSALPLTAGRAIGYGVVAGIAAQAAHAWGLRPMVEALLKRVVLKLPTAVLLVSLVVGVGVGGCGTVTLTAKQEGRCKIQPKRPFLVECWSDGRLVLHWDGDMDLGVQGEVPHGP